MDARTIIRNRFIDADDEEDDADNAGILIDASNIKVDPFRCHCAQRQRRPRSVVASGTRRHIANSIFQRRCCRIFLGAASAPILLLVVFLNGVTLVSAFAPPWNRNLGAKTLDRFQPTNPPYITKKSSSSSSRSRISYSTLSTSRMGIKGFRAWFESQFPKAITSMPKEKESNGSGAGAKANSNARTEEFDHVLIDMNQILHIVLRKSRSEGHCLTLLMKELDACLQLATPTQSLVLAMDGSPGAAKLATQRRRRYHTVRKTNAKVAQYEKLIAAASTPKSTNNSTSTAKNQPLSKKARKNIQQWTRKKMRALAETRTLCITPGTEFMDKAEQTLLYWAWQRLSARQSILSINNVKVFVSPSTVPGEGEVKLLEWIYTKQRRGESVAILGGDSDLVLEALVIPLASTHNVFVLLPDGNTRYLAVSLWETSRTLIRLLPHVISTPQAMIQVRTDLVLLLILNGNDYLPKLRGSSGFNKLFHTYLRLQREWHAKMATEEEEQEPTTSSSWDADRRSRAFLVNPDTLQFNLEFAQAFFQRLAGLAPANLWKRSSSTTVAAKGGGGAATTANENQSSNVNGSDTPLQQLNILLDGGFLPKPIKFLIVEDDANDDDENEGSAAPVVEVSTLDESDDEDDDKGDEEESEDANDDDVDVEDVNQVLVRLQLGIPGSEDFFTYEVRHTRNTALKKAKHKLAAMALADFMDDEEETDGDEDDDDENENGELGAAKGYDWEIHHNVEGKVESYLYGLLWNLQTYQDGVCANYSFNYGKRMSPPAKDIAAFFASALLENRTVGQRDLYGMDNDINNPQHGSSPVSAGLSCLAALPSSVQDLVPKPYRWLPGDTVEAFYASCMDPEDNVFDIKRFERLCEDELRSMDLPERTDESGEQNNEPLESTSEHYWTVVYKVHKPLAKPFDPPVPFSDRHGRLKANDKIRISRYAATTEPRSREFQDGAAQGEIEEEKRIRHSDPGMFFERVGNIENVDYRVAYQKNKKERKGLRKGKVTLTLQGSSAPNGAIFNGLPSVSNGAAEHSVLPSRLEGTRDGVSRPQRDDESKYNNLGTPPAQPVENLEGETAMAVLKQLADVGLIGPMKWESVTPSPSKYAAFDPRNHELVRLSVTKGSDPAAMDLREPVLTFEQDRETNNVARKMVQQHLASIALHDITGPNVCWTDMTYKDLKKFLSEAMVPLGGQHD